MRTIGLLGGMSWESTAEYYRVINEAVRERLGGLHSAPIVLASVDFAEIAALQSAGDWAAAGRVLGEHAAGLERAGAQSVLICTNTMHLVADEVAAAIGVPLLHVVDVAAAAARRSGLDRVGLLGTAFTMEQAFYRDRLAAHGLEVLVPGAEDRALVHRVIFDELVVGDVRESSRTAFVEVVGRLAAAGAQGVVLGCTEIELLLDPAASAVPLFPTARLHAEAAVAWAIDGELPAAPTAAG